MAENKTQPTKTSVTSFLNTISDPVRKADGKALVKLMRKASGKKPTMWGPAIVGFGRYHYKYASGREGDMPLVGFSPRKSATVLYLQLGFREAKGLLARLGKYKATGKVCLYVPKLEAVDQEVLAELVVKSMKAMRAKHKV